VRARARCLAEIGDARVANWLMPVVVQTVDELGLVRCTTYSVQRLGARFDS